MRLLCRTLALAWLALNGAARVSAIAETAPAAPPVRLEAPLHGAELQAGSVAALAWEPLGPFDLLPQVQEWEAFLSLDGGAHYPIRITPHLDRDLRRVFWQVPHFPTRDARLLLRFGDEHRETALELQERFAISGTAPLDLWTVSRAASPGEPARPGDAGVVLWAQGTRHGGSSRQVIAWEGLGLASGRSMIPAVAEELALESEDPVPDPTPLSAGQELRWPAVRPARASSAHAAWPAPIPILLLTQRQNE